MVIRVGIAVFVAAGIGVATAPAALADPPWGSCKAAAADGAFNIRKGDPGYSTKLDRDGDGIACERK